MSTRTLTDEDVDAIARAVAALIADSQLQPRLVDAATLASQLGLSRDTVYAKADELGAIRLGDGPRARLRFDPTAARAALAAKRNFATTIAAAPKAAARQPRRPVAGHLLPIRGEGAA